MTVLSQLSAISRFSFLSKPNVENRSDLSAQNTPQTESPIGQSSGQPASGQPAYPITQPDMSSSANSSSTIAKIKESNQVSSGTTAKPAKDSESPPLIETTAQIAEVPSYLNGNGFAAEDDTLTTISGTAIKGQSPQLKAIDSKLRLEPAEAVTISSYLRSDNGIGERAAEQGASEIASNAAMVQPRLTESTAAQPIRDFLTAETAAAATYEEIISQQRQGITAQANQSQLRVLQLLK